MRRIFCSLPLGFILLLMMAGCSGRDSEADEPDVFCEVGIKIDWGETEKMPEGMEVLFYPQDAEGKTVVNYISATGGSSRLKPGSYRVVIFNYDTEAIQIRGADKLETLEAYTGQCTGLSNEGSKGMVWEPDPLYVAQADITIDETDKAKTLEVKPRLIPKTCSFEIKVEGLEYITSVSASVSGMAASYFIGTGCCSTDSCTIYFDMQKGDDALKGSFAYFGTPRAVARAFSVSQLIIIQLMKRDGTVMQTKIDVTEAIRKAEEEAEENPGETPGTDPGEGTGGFDIHIDIDEEIEIPYVPPKPSEGEGVFGGDVDEWGDETEVVIPIL